MHILHSAKVSRELKLVKKVKTDDVTPVTPCQMTPQTVYDTKVSFALKQLNSAVMVLYS